MQCNVAPMIVLFGIDGSGKTTQAELLCKAVARSICPATYVWARWDPYFLRPFLLLGRYLAGRQCAKLSPRQGDIKEDLYYTNLSSTKKRVFRIPAMRIAWKYMVLIEYYFQIKRLLRRNLKNDGVIVCDRYIYDLAADLSGNFSYDYKRLHSLLRLLHSCFPRPALSLLIDLPPEEGYRRKADGTPLNYLRARAAIYRDIAEIAGAKVVDGARDVSDVHGSILEFVMEKKEWIVG